MSITSRVTEFRSAMKEKLRLRNNPGSRGVIYPLPKPGITGYLYGLSGETDERAEMFGRVMSGNPLSTDLTLKEVVTTNSPPTNPKQP